MKLQRLKINAKFRSLKPGFEINFRYPYESGITEDDWMQFHPFCFAGLNGSGKSNVLEALANIFYHLESCVNVRQPKNFLDNFEYKDSAPDAFELEYFIVPKLGDNYISNEDYIAEKLCKVTIKKEEGRSPIMGYQTYPFSSDEIIDLPITPKDKKIGKRKADLAKSYLPNLVIAYSSGENEILSIPFLKSRLLQFDEYEEDLINEYNYKEPESILIYIDYEMSQAVLLSNLIFNNEKDSENNVLKPIREELKILDITRFRMVLRNHISKENEKFRILDQLRSSENQQDDEDRIVDKFKNCATTLLEIDNQIILDFWVNKATKDAFKENFKGGIFELFQAFQLLYTLNYRDVAIPIKTDVYQSKGYYTDGKLPHPSPESQVFYFLNYYIEQEKEDGLKELLLKNLSDGEQQFLHSLGICLMLKNRNALLLLDEPETHFNPDWRSKFIRTLKRSLERSGSNNLMRDILITSHSPFIISDCFPDKVLIFNKDEDGKVFAKKAENLGIHTFGTSIHILTNKVFGKKETIADYSLNLLKSYKERYQNGESLEKLISEINLILGDSIEKLLMINELKGLQNSN